MEYDRVIPKKKKFYEDLIKGSRHTGGSPSFVVLLRFIVNTIIVNMLYTYNVIDFNTI